MKTENKYIGWTLLATVIGFWLSRHFLNLTVSQINLNDASVIRLNSDFWANYDILFALSIGLLPLMYLVTLKIGRLQTAPQKYLATTIILISGIAAWQFRISAINQIETFLATGFPALGAIHQSIEIDSLKLGNYFAIGCILGMVLSAAIFRKINQARDHTRRINY